MAQVLEAIVTLDGKKFLVELPSIGVAKEGFWLNENCDYTVGNDSVLWVPPSAVICVRKTYKRGVQ